MSEEVKKLPYPKAEEVIAYFEPKGGIGACESCKTNEWNIFADEGESVCLMQSVVQADGSTLRNQVRMLTFVCKRCTLVRQYLYKPFAEWMETRKQSSSPP